MMFFKRNKAPSPVGSAADLSPQGEAKGAEPHLSLGERGGEGALPAPDCAIWNDIARALDIKPRGAK